MKFVSFNINGLRARPHQLAAIVEKHQPDVIGLQETKVHDDMFPLEEVARLGYNVFYHGQKGHYGVALLTKETPIAVRRGFPDDGEEAQRRIIMAEIPSPFGNVTVINGYFPQGESRDHETKFPAKAAFLSESAELSGDRAQQRESGADHGRYEHQSYRSGHRYR